MTEPEPTPVTEDGDVIGLPPAPPSDEPVLPPAPPATPPPMIPPPMVLPDDEE
jgi:hypothetical protein